MSESAALAIVEVLDRDGQVRHSQRVLAWPLRIGRALDNELSLGDVHVAPHHCVIDVDAEGLVLQALHTANGVQLGARAGGGEGEAGGEQRPGEPARRAAHRATCAS